MFRFDMEVSRTHFCYTQDSPVGSHGKAHVGLGCVTQEPHAADCQLLLGLIQPAHQSVVKTSTHSQHMY